MRPGDTLNHGAYRIERELGAGGFGVVYLAEELRLRRKVAIKTLLPDLMAREPGLTETFYAEARLTAGLAHPHILPILFVGEEERGGERYPYIVMEYIEGGDLEAVLAQGRGDFSQRVRWMRQIADGLAYAHAQGVIHRDLKPRNIFLTRTNTAKIGDFGLAKVMGAETQTVLKGLGTAAYIAPEQIQGRPADARADLYALGVMYYQILTGHLPYDAPGVSDVVAKIMAICYQHVNAPIPSARTRNPDIPPELDALTQRLMAKTPEARPASAAEVIPVLEACLHPAGPPPPVTQTVEGLTPRASVPVPTEGGTPLPEPPHQQAPAPPESPIAPTQAVVPPPTRVPRPWLALPVGVLILLAVAFLLWPKQGVEVPSPPPAPMARPGPLAQAPAPDAEPQETARRAAEADQQRRQAEEERRRLQAEVEAARKQVEELRLAKLREERRQQQEAKRAEDTARKQAEETRLATLRTEQQRQAEAKKAEDEAARKRAEVARLQAEDTARKQAEEARLKAEAERKRKAEEVEQARMQEQRRQEEARKATEAQQAKARDEAARKQAEDLARQKAADVARSLDPAQLQRQVVQRLRDSGVPGLTVAVSPDRSVRLTGAVDSTRKKDQALKLVSGIAGVTQVRDRVLVTAGCREPAPAPKYYTGEAWTWRDDKGAEWTDRVVAEGDVTQIQAANGDVFSYDKERILQKVVRQTGEVVTEGLTAQGVLGAKAPDFPLEIGKRWQYQYSTRVSSGFDVLIDQNTIVVCEELTTPAGKLEAFKIETVSRRAINWRGEQGVAYRWYAPRVKSTIRRQYVPSQWWSGERYLGYELIRYVSE